MSDDKEKLIEQFSSISGVDAERSRFYLESAAWNIESALSSLYEEDDNQAADLNNQQANLNSQTKNDKPPSMPRINLADSDSSDEEGQAFYAGGSEHSGQQVLGPSKKKDVVSKLFASAKKHGAEVVESANSSVPKLKQFSGAGYKLGETEDDHEMVSKPSAKESKPKDVTLKMWKSGFSVDDGPLRSFEDPANHEFLNSVRRGEVPLELIKNARGGEVYINMEDHRHEDFVPTKSKLVAFSGSGQSLGSPAPEVIGQVRSGGAAAGSSSASPEVLEKEAKERLATDSSKPTTNIQLRLPDGSRIVLKLNHSHTVGDIRRFVAAARPSLPASVSLMTTFPHARLDEDAKTVTEANILNAVLVVK